MIKISIIVPVHNRKKITAKGLSSLSLALDYYYNQSELIKYDIILVDDVLFTGRTIRSGLDALLSFGRPKSVELLVLIDRRFRRDLPIEANYIGKAVDTLLSERVSVEWAEIEGQDKIVLYSKENDE